MPVSRKFKRIRGGKKSRRRLKKISRKVGRRTRRKISPAVARGRPPKPRASEQRHDFAGYRCSACGELKQAHEFSGRMLRRARLYDYENPFASIGVLLPRCRECVERGRGDPRPGQMAPEDE